MNKKLLLTGSILLGVLMMNFSNIPYWRCPKCGEVAYGIGVHQCPKGQKK